jgi:hypothetical protein
MLSWRSFLVLSALAATLTACCCPCGALIDGSILGQANFTTGDFVDAPAYPGATQTTETDTAINAMIAAMTLLSEESEWKHYTTGDSPDDVLAWYEAELPTYGWFVGDFEDAQVEGALFFIKATEPNTALYLIALEDFEGGNVTHIILGRVQLPIEVEE